MPDILSHMPRARIRKDCLPPEVEERVNALMGRYTVQVISYMPDGIEIGLTDMSDENIRLIKNELREAGIDTNAAEFILVSGSDSDNWQDYEKYEFIADVEDAIYVSARRASVLLVFCAFLRMLIH